jgi:hypothetical protein
MVKICYKQFSQKILLLVKIYRINLLIKIYMRTVQSENIANGKDLYNQFTDKNTCR